MTNPSNLTDSRPDSEPLYYSQEGFVDGAAVFHGFFSRRGGVSKDVYASLNCGAGSDDEPEHVKQNRAIVAEIVGCAPDHLLSLYQIHSPRCMRVEKPWGAERPEADAMATDKAGIALGILTADCGPVLFSGQKADGSAVVAAAHAGWGGALKGVLESSIRAMEDLGAEKGSIRAVVGPCISRESYEVGEEFVDPFLKEDEESERFFMAGQRAGHLMFDLPGYCAFRLARAGLKKVFIKDLDTYFNEEDFFSYRRKTHRKEKDYGRQISVIMIQE